MPCQALVILTVYTCLGVPASIIFGMHGGFQGVRLVRHLCTWHLAGVPGTWHLAGVPGTWAPGHLAPGLCAWPLAPGHLGPSLCAWHLGTWAPGTWLVCLAPGTWHLGRAAQHFTQLLGKEPAVAKE